MSTYPPLIQSLTSASCYPHDVESIELIETHISWVILTGVYAYKIKRPVTYDFVDFSELSDRRTYCEQEISLNRRLAETIYLEVVPITGSETDPTVDGAGEPVEYAVKMNEFPQRNLFSSRLDRNELTPESVDRLAVTVSEFHQSIEDEPPQDELASTELIRENTMENFEAIDTDRLDEDALDTFRWIRRWTQKRFDELSSLFPVRRRNGSVRNCHGDMHLRNIVEYQDEIQVFDCVEFNENFRWIDVMDEVAFLTMDLTHKGRPDLASRFLDRYLTYSNQYDGLPLLDFYRVYRAMVRCKVNYLNDDSDKRDGPPDAFLNYLNTARQFTDSNDPVLLITHGLSGSGKTSVTDTILERMGAVRLRSDIERKRLAGVTFRGNHDGETDRDLYTTEMTHRTYGALKTKAETVLRAGFPVIVDATFLKQQFRHEFRGLAEQLEVPFRIVNVTCAEGELRRRLIERRKRETVSDAGVNVLDYQLEMREELSPQEETHTITIATDGAGLTENVLRSLESLVEN